MVENIYFVACIRYQLQSWLRYLQKILKIGDLRNCIAARRRTSNVFSTSRNLKILQRPIVVLIPHPTSKRHVRSKESSHHHSHLLSGRRHSNRSMVWRKSEDRAEHQKGSTSYLHIPSLLYLTSKCLLYRLHKKFEEPHLRKESLSFRILGMV